MGTHLPTFISLHPGHGIEAVMGTRVLPSGQGSLYQPGGSQVVVEIQEEMVRENRGKV